MTIWPTARPAIRSRIASYRRILRQESESPGGFGDDRGRRFLLFSLYFRLREDTEVCAYIDWYRATFPDDHVFATQCLCWALILRRLGRLDEAVYRFVQAVDDNIPVVADVVGDLQVPYGIREDELWQLYRMDETVIAAMTADERNWLRETWRLPAIVTLREKCIAHGRLFAAVTTESQGAVLLDAGRALVAAFLPEAMPPLSSGASWLSSGRQSTRPRSNRKVIRTSPDLWRRDGSPAVPVEMPHEIVVRFSDRGPLRLRGMISRAEAEQVARRLMGRTLMGDGIVVSLATASAFAIVPDGQGPADAEAVVLPRT